MSNIYKGPWIALYSKLAEPSNGTVLYERANGEQVTATCVAKPGTKFRYEWPDVENRGEVVKFVRRLSSPLLTQI